MDISSYQITSAQAHCVRRYCTWYCKKSEDNGLVKTFTNDEIVRLHLNKVTSIWGRGGWDGFWRLRTGSES